MRTEKSRPRKHSSTNVCNCGKNGWRAVVHLHSTYSVAVSLLKKVDERDVLPPLTAYYVMRVGALPLVPYFPPGDQTLAAAVGTAAADHHAVLMANHGPIVAGKTLRDAQYATEELEETAKLFVLLQHHEVRPLHARAKKRPYETCARVSGPKRR